MTACVQDIQHPIQIATEICGFITIIGGTFLLHTTRDLDVSFSDLSRLAKEAALTTALLNHGSKRSGSDQTPGREDANEAEQGGMSRKFSKGKCSAAPY